MLPSCSNLLLLPPMSEDNRMTRADANMLAFLRVRHNYSFGLLCQAARAIWGEDWVSANCNAKGGDSIRGRCLVTGMENVLGLETCESDDMALAQCVCNDCKQVDFYLTPKADVAKQCGHCGGLKTFLIE